MKPDTADPVAFFSDRFAATGTEERARQEKKYLKSAMIHYGVPVPGIRAAVKQFRRTFGIPDRSALLSISRALWVDPHYEMKAAAIALLEAERDHLLARDMDRLASMLADCTTWAQVDWLAPHVAGHLVERFPSCLAQLDRWAVHPVFWVRRASLLALLLPIRRTGQHFDRFARYAAAMLTEKEFFIRKAIGWVLREASKKHPDMVHRFVADHATELSPLTFREGTRCLPITMREQLAALRSGRSR